MQNSKELTMNIGSLYRVKEWYWFLFPSKESAEAAEAAHLAVGVDPHAAQFTFAAAERSQRWLRKKFKENVTYFSPDSYIVFLEEDGKFKKVLTSDGLIGWTWFKERYPIFNDCFEEVSS